MALNGSLCKVLCEIFRSPLSSKVDWNDAARVLKALGSTITPTKSGMRSDFGNGMIWISRRPHPKPLMDKAAVKDLKTHFTWLVKHPPSAAVGALEE